MEEIHSILRSDDLRQLIAAEKEFCASHSGAVPVCRRWFLSDPSQENTIRQLCSGRRGAESFIIQPPLDGSVAALWIYMVKGADEIIFEDGLSAVKCGDAEFFWTSGITSELTGSESQTSDILTRYGSFLESRGMSVAHNCVRTWFFCHDIDNNYSGLVKARRENFLSLGLTPQTHYIASTGICGTPCEDGALVQMEALAVRGSFSQRYLYAPSNLNPTYEYGVTFERGVRLDFLDLPPKVIISGTASIDNHGNVLHIGDVVSQTLRMWENVEVLLLEGGAEWRDLKHIIVYLRNASDYPVVAPMFAAKFPGIPYVILLAPVCRPDWLIEMECMT